jgi:hypothetical protein
MEEHQLHVFGNEIRKVFRPTKDEVTEQFRILRNREIITCTGQLVLLEQE